jgi:transposase
MPTHTHTEREPPLDVIALCRHEPRRAHSRTYVARRTEEGKTKKEIIRCLKRYIAREVYRILASLSLNKPPISVP